MTHTDELRRQHDAAIQLMVGISGQIGAYCGHDDAYRLTLGVAQLIGLMRLHLTIEDGHLYPRLFGSDHAPTAALARRFAREMGDLAEQLEEYARRWSSSAGITARFAEFGDETARLFAALETRIQCENQQLYPLADRLAEPPLRSAA